MADINISVTTFERKLADLTKRFETLDSQMSKVGDIGGDTSEFSRFFKDFIKIMQEGTDALKNYNKAHKDAAVSLSALSKSAFQGGVGIAQTLSSLSRGDILGAASGAMNVGSAIGAGASTLGLGGTLGLMGAGAIAGLGAMAVNRIQQNYETGFSNQQQVHRFFNLMQGQVPGIGMGGGAFGGPGFREMAIRNLMMPGEAAGVGMAYLQAGGKPAGAGKEIEVFLEAQKNLGANAGTLANAIGDFVQWGQESNLTNVFGRAGQAAFESGAKGFFISGEWSRAQGMMARALRTGGGAAGAIDDRILNNILSMGFRAGYTPGVTAQAVSSAMAGLPGAVENPPAFAFLMGATKLSMREMAFPDEKTAGKLFNFFSDKTGKGPRGFGMGTPEAVLYGMQGTPLAPMANLLARMQFPEQFGEKPPTKEDFEKAMKNAMEGEETRQEQIRVAVQKSADALSGAGRSVVGLLTTMDSALQIISVGAMKGIIGLFGDRGAYQRYKESGASEADLKEMFKGKTKRFELLDEFKSYTGKEWEDLTPAERAIYGGGLDPSLERTVPILRKRQPPSGRSWGTTKSSYFDEKMQSFANINVYVGGEKTGPQMSAEWSEKGGNNLIQLGALA